MNVELYEVGGCVRDELLGVPTKDIDYTVVGPKSFEDMCTWLDDKGFKFFKFMPGTFTARAHFPAGWSFAGRDCSKLTADFVLARKERDYTNGRHPDSVEVGTLEDDLSRRDYTVNAMAKDSDGNLIDLFTGQKDLSWMRLRAVGKAEDRLREDALRALRAIRFCIVKGFWWDSQMEYAMNSWWLPPLVADVALDRRRGEMLQCFKHDTIRTMKWLATMNPGLVEAIFAGGLWLEPTNKS